MTLTLAKLRRAAALLRRSKPDYEGDFMSEPHVRSHLLNPGNRGVADCVHYDDRAFSLILAEDEGSAVARHCRANFHIDEETNEVTESGLEVIRALHAHLTEFLSMVNDTAPANLEELHKQRRERVGGFF